MLLLERDSLLDFTELNGNEVVVHVALRVDVGRNLLGLLMLALGDQPTRGLGTVQREIIWIMEGMACRRQGTRHAHWPSSLFVPKATQEPIKEPRYQRVLLMVL